MSDRIKNKCDKCHRTSSNRVIEIEMEGRVGRTALGRKVDILPQIGVWECPKCSYRQVVNFTLPLDPDQPLLAAYESKFGPADNRAIAALAAVNDQFIVKFGDDWGTDFGKETVEWMLSQIIEPAKNHFGDEWATAIREADFSFIEEEASHES